MAHFKDRWGDRPSGFVFLTLTLRPSDVAIHTPLECAETLRKWFTNRLVRRIQRRTSARPLYLAQVDFASRNQHPHLHALIETDLSAQVIGGLWVDIGGGIDVDVKPLGNTADDVAKTAGYIVKASRWGSGRLLCSQGHGFNTTEAKRERQRHAIAAAGGPDTDAVFLYEAAERREAPVPRARVETFDSSERAPAEQILTYSMQGGSYRLRRTYDGRERLLHLVVEEEVAQGAVRSYRRLCAASRREVAERFLRRYDARRRQRGSGR